MNFRGLLILRATHPQKGAFLRLCRAEMRFTLQSLENAATYFGFPWFYSNKNWESNLPFCFLLRFFHCDVYVSSDQVWISIPLWFAFLYGLSKINVTVNFVIWKIHFSGNLKLNQRVWNQKVIQLNLPFNLLTIFV